MVFSSPRFLIFLACTLALLAFPWRHATKKQLLAAASCLFYAAWDYRYLGLLLLISVIDYVCADLISRAQDEARRRRILFFSVASNLGVLGYFKYANFFLQNVNGLEGITGVTFAVQDILLPAGISFYTFKSMSYTIDVYRRHIEPCQSWIDYAMFVAFFPELIAGPIVRASVFLPQMTRPIGPTAERLRIGLSLFLVGLTKKVFVADRLAVISDAVFANPAAYGGLTIWMGVLAYAGQIFCDFSGYSDMAIGTARLLGYELPENFNMPYLSTSITEFWRRWHITLSSWLRDYLYIPLGGNRHGKGRTYLNLMATMLLGGLWHGASWNFVLWGALHGVALAAHKLLGDLRKGHAVLPKWVGGIATFVFVTLTWVPFRAKDWGTTAIMLRKMLLVGDDGGVAWFPPTFAWLAAAVVLGHLAGVALQGFARGQVGAPWVARLLTAFGGRVRSSAVSGWSLELGAGGVAGAFLVALWVSVVLLFSPAATNPFIYFQF